MVKIAPAKAGNSRDTGLIPGSERFPGEGNGNPLQYSSLGNPMDREAWWATVHGVAELDMTEHAHTHIYLCLYKHTADISTIYFTVTYAFI